jgi:hypothetical protein
MSKVSDDLTIMNVREPPEGQDINILADEFHGTIGHQRLDSTGVSAAVTPGILPLLWVIVDDGIDSKM